jgi:hypothetical protein
MKYIEELKNGDTFLLNNKIYFLTSDFKSNGYKLCYCLEDGFPSWISGSEVIQESPLFKLDKENNIIPIKNVSDTPTNFSQISSLAHQ